MHVSQLNALAISRRTILGGGAAGLAAVAFAPAFAQPLMPEVDTLTLQVLVDNIVFGPFLPDLSLPGLKVVRHGGISPGGVMSRRALQAEFGLSILATSHLGGAAAQVLVDFGYSPETARNNLALLGVDLSRLDAAVLSHGHLDHYGGFPAFLEGTGHRVPLYVGGEETFCERLAMIGNPPLVMGALDRAALAQAGFDVRIASTPQIIKGARGYPHRDAARQGVRQSRAEPRQARHRPAAR
jgi:7,8-dihydropterin-6-yl-methyl-4-(beta-D-ribofuranosyl)aminobenzene 5'-phosphate synthase